MITVQRNGLGWFGCEAKDHCKPSPANLTVLAQLDARKRTVPVCSLTLQGMQCHADLYCADLLELVTRP